MRPSAIIATCLALAGAAQAQTADDNVAGTDGTNDLGHLQCAANASAIAESCPYEVLRKDDGTLTLRVLFPGGTGRSVYFDQGEITGASTPEEVSSETFKSGAMLIYIGTEMRIEVPPGVITPAE
ncbi:MAG: hypothetical protein OIF47_14565 [Marinibacterium sp.]|nr:hypothetical protein [Marinibacterium sp.]